MPLLFFKTNSKSMKAIHHRFCLLALFVAMMSFAGCNKLQSEPEDTYEATITVSGSTSSLTLASDEGSEGKITFSCDHQWKLEIPEDAREWLSADKMEGGLRKFNTITFIAKENTGATRRATCRIISGASQAKITVIQEMAVLIISASDVPNIDKYYKPAEFSGFDMLRSDAQWSWCRSAQSEHFFLFWGKEYGAYGLYGQQAGVENTSPKTLDASDVMYVDIDDLLQKAEEFYRVNIEQLKFAETGNGSSNLDKYKMQIYLHHTTTWMAYGSGYDNVIGALWINPATCKPVGSTIAHEIGHSFQYQVYADAIAAGAPNDFSTGWRYEIGQGCGFWEQCAQWQAYQSYCEQAFTTVNFTEFVNNCHRHFTHEHQRYASYFLMWYWASLHGVQEIGELWRLCQKPEDPIETYQRKHNLGIEQLNDELYDYAARCVSWDFPVEATNLYEGQLTGVTAPVSEFGKDYIGKIGWASKYDAATGFYAVDTARAPEATGFNHIRLNLPEDGQHISVRFESLVGQAPYHKVSDPSIAQWRVGFVALMQDASRQYSTPTVVSGSADIEYTVPTGCQKLYMVVAATPKRYLQHLWDENNSNDEHWPYQVKFSGTDLFGNISFDGSEKPYSTSFERSISASAAAGYAGPSWEMDEDLMVGLAKAFVMQPSDIKAAITTDINNVRSSKVKFLAVNSDGKLDASYMSSTADKYYTANGFGFWLDAEGNNKGWSAGYTFVEYTPTSWTFQFGVHPDKVKSGSIKEGDVLPVNVAFVYNTAVVTINFKIKITK